MEITKQVKEICYIYHKRNLLGKKRDSLRYKYKYLQSIKQCIRFRDVYKNTEQSVPKRFRNTSLSEINLMLLEAEAKVCLIKAEIMKHTHKYDKKLKSVNMFFSPDYSCGMVKGIRFHDGKSYSSNDEIYINAVNIERYHDEYLADKAIDKMLRG